VIAIYALIALFGLAAGYQALGSFLDSRRSPPPGRLLDTPHGRLHLHETGSGYPVVVLESGIAASSVSWALIQPRVAEWTRVASYDRAGLGWSGPCSAPRSVEQMVAELSGLLAAAQLSPPYILAGHSFGGLLIRAFAHLRPADVAGLVFVDPVSLTHWGLSSAEELRRLETGIALSRRAALLARLGIVRASLALLAAGGRHLPNLIARAAGRRATGVISNILVQIQKLPAAFLPMIRSHWSNPKSFRAMAAYLACLPESARAALDMPIPAATPFIVLSASAATAAELAERDAWVRASPHARHEIVPDTGHWLQLERPDVVAGAIRELFDRARAAPNV
jgi:pimeloyl-ACP methyl ester carboxylesterase